MTPEQLAEAILRAAGSGLRHYTPQSRERIIEAARQVVENIRNEESQHDTGGRKHGWS